MDSFGGHVFLVLQEKREWQRPSTIDYEESIKLLDVLRQMCAWIRRIIDPRKQSWRAQLVF